MARLSRSQHFLYAMGRMGSSALLGLFSFSVFPYYWLYTPLDSFKAGFALMISKVLMAVASLFTGSLSDILPIAGMRRKPYIFMGSLMLSASTVLIYYYPTGVDLFLYLLVTSVMFSIAYKVLIDPYQAMLPEISDPDERVAISQLQNLFNAIGDGAGIVLSFSLPYLGVDFFKKAVVALAIFQMFCYLPTLIGIPEPREYKIMRLERYVKVLLDRNFELFAMTIGVGGIGFAITSSFIVAFVSELIKLENLMSEIWWLAIVGLGGFASFLLWPVVEKRIGIDKAFITASAILGAGMMVAATSSFSRLGLMFSLLFIASGIIGLWIFRYVILANIIEQDIVRSGESAAGTYTAISGVLENAYLSVAYVLSGALSKTPFWRLAWGPASAAFVFLSIIPFLYVNPFPPREAEPGGDSLAFATNQN